MPVPHFIPGPGWTDGALNEDYPRDIHWDEFGIASGACYYNCRYAYGQALVTEIKSHPDFDFMIRKNSVMKREEGGMAKVQINFTGIEDGIQGHWYSTKASTSLQPVETHPKFKADIGGYGRLSDLSHAKNGARFDREGKFIGFGTVDENGNAVGDPKFIGTRSYYAPSVCYEQTSVLGANFSVNDIADDLGKIDANVPNGPSGVEGSGEGLDGDLPTIQTVDDEVRNWLKLGVDVSPLGRGHRRLSRWMLSGPRGWNNVIYGTANEVTGNEVEIG